MKRLLLNLCTACSVLLIGAAVAMWVRGASIGDTICRKTVEADGQSSRTHAFTLTAGWPAGVFASASARPSSSIAVSCSTFRLTRRASAASLA